MRDRKERIKESAFLELLCNAYISRQEETDPKTVSYFQELDRHLSSLPEKARDAIFHVVYCLYSEKERTAYAAGIQAGIRLLRELAEV